MTNRRSVLCGLAALPAATLPAAAAVASNTDAALIAQAEAVQGLVARREVSWTKRADLADRLDDLCPAPHRPTTIQQFETTTERHADGGITIRQVPLSTERERKAVYERETAALADHEKKRERVLRQIGLHAADRQGDRISRNLINRAA